MKYYFYIALAVLLLLLTVVSIFLYNNWYTTRYDDLIIKESERYDLPPALIKALIYSRKQREGVYGIMGVPQEGIVLYQQSMMTRDYQFLCLNRSKVPHEKKLFEKRDPCPVCKQPYVEEFLQPEISVEIGTWYLAYGRKEMEKAFGLQSQASLEMTLYGYLFGLQKLQEETLGFTRMILTDKMKAELYP